MNIDNFHFDRAGSFLKNKKKKEKKSLMRYMVIQLPLECGVLEALKNDLQQKWSINVEHERNINTYFRISRRPTAFKEVVLRGEQRLGV